MCVCFTQVGDFADANSWPTPGEIATKDMQVGVCAIFKKQRRVENCAYTYAVIEPCERQSAAVKSPASTVSLLEFHISIFVILFYFLQNVAVKP